MILSSIMVTPFYITITTVYILGQHLLFSIFLCCYFFFLTIATPMALKCYLIAVLVCIFLITSDLEHLFMSLLAICISLFRKTSIQILSPFFSQVYLLLLLNIEIFCAVGIILEYLKHVSFLTFSGAKYSLLAHTTLTLESAENNFKTHNLSINGNGKYSLYFTYYICYVDIYVVTVITSNFKMFSWSGYWLK